MNVLNTFLELPVEVEFDYHPGHPAKLFGPPENCCPENPLK